jgi:hypothetical protein
MTFSHGKETVITLNAVDLSAFITTSQFERTGDSHDVTTYGQDSHVFAGGLLTGTATMSGVYDNGSSGPRDTIEPLIGTVVAFTRRPEGTGSGLPHDACNVLVEKYVETSPVADMVTWSCDMQISGDVTSTNQA